MIPNIHDFLNDQLAVWETARDNYAALSRVQVKELTVRGIPYKVQFNPARIVSSGAKVDAKSIRERKCFLCDVNRPAVQRGISFLERYDILVNPFPIFPRHLTIPLKTHLPQKLSDGRISDMLELAYDLPDYTLFYNGPRCGASAPDHFHFQAGNRGFMPIEEEWRKQKAEGRAKKICDYKQASVWRMDDAPRNTLVIESTYKMDAMSAFAAVYNSMTRNDDEPEPMMNLLAFYEQEAWTLFVFPRAKHRPACYTAEGEAQLLSSPASVDLGGVFILPVEKDFRKITAGDIEQILSEVCLSDEAFDELCERIRERLDPAPTIRVGILSGKEIRFTLPTHYLMSGTYCNSVVTYQHVVRGEQLVSYEEGGIRYDGHTYETLKFIPMDFAHDVFELHDVTIGINFHWERKENQRFQGALTFVVENGQLTAVNVIDVESYLTSVISSEMSATASQELLKAHAVISRSWVMSSLSPNPSPLGRGTDSSAQPSPLPTGEGLGERLERLLWYERNAHTLYDVCADDHCQRYQGVTRATTEAVRRAVRETRGLVLMSEGKICDARFSKCCGGAFEEFRYCWADKRFPYLRRKRDWSDNRDLPDLTQEAEADRWIRTAPDAFCHTKDKSILSQVLNNYDQETTDFYRWRVVYTQEELSRLIRERSGTDYGDIIDLQPVARGTSGRLWKLRIVGTRLTQVIGKELEIRRTLSPSHLYSSAFVVDKEGSLPTTLPDGSQTEVPARFVLTGAGWGHGVGLCQIGAAVMGEKGYSYREILEHYYPGTNLSPSR